MYNRTRLLLSAAVAASSLACGTWSHAAPPTTGTDLAPTTGPAIAPTTLPGPSDTGTPGVTGTTGVTVPSDTGTGVTGNVQIGPGPTTAESAFPLDLRRADVSAGTVTQSRDLPSATRAPMERPLMRLLDQTPAGDFLHRYNINVYGWVEGSYTYNFDNPPVTGHFGRLNIGRSFDIEDNDFLVNQLDLTVERKADLNTGRFNVGGRMDLLYGTDSRFVHSNGMFDDVDFLHGPQYQFDIPQLYLDFAIPVADNNAIRLRVGKFEFFKPLDPNASPFYSHTFLYAAGGQSGDQSKEQALVAGAALPFTLTGVSAYYAFSKQWDVELGLSRGFDQSLDDANSAIDAFGRVNYNLSRSTKISFALITGPEVNHDNSHYRTVGDLSVIQVINPKLYLLFDGVYGIQTRPGTFAAPAGTVFAPTGSPIGGDAHWYGVSGNAFYKYNKYVSAAARLEWFRDEEGFTTGLPQSLYEATVGLTFSPFPDDAAGSGLKIRPEVRYDYSDHRYFKAFTGHHQWTFGIDAIYNF